MNRNTLLTGITYCLIPALAWGGMFPVMQVALKVLDPFYFTTIRYIWAGLILLGMLIVFEGKNVLRLEGESWKLLFFGAVGFSGFGFLTFVGQKLSGPSGAIIASVIMALMPLMTTCVNWALHKSKPNLSTFISIFIALSGAMLVITNGDPSLIVQIKEHIGASLLIMLGALCWVIYTMGGSQFAGWSPLRYTALTTCFGSLMNILIVLSATVFGALTMPSAERIGSVGAELLYMILIAGVLAVFTWNVGNKILKPENGMLFMNIVPVTTVTISALQGVEVGRLQLAGTFIVIIALVINNLTQRRGKMQVNIQNDPS
ncbi:transporter [Paenibacillus chitinolyticus]|uniref:DMT family transporter n=1 Tax=Paenibacillus chitinolyticus TaxID=79263 RepID=UPI0026E4F76E|nr:DMT family transporter [Paenibacillus chitinolyticus]GKS11004.1 transporter [Paenibacillus chitinolyticus]